MAKLRWLGCFSLGLGCAATFTQDDLDAQKAQAAARSAELERRHLAEKEVAREELDEISKQLKAARREATSCQTDMTAVVDGAAQAEQEVEALRMRVLEEQCKAEERAAEAAAPKKREVPIERVQKYCAFTFTPTLDGATARIDRTFAVTKVAITPGTSPGVSCKPGTPADVEAAAIAVVRLSEPDRVARLIGERDGGKGPCAELRRRRQPAPRAPSNNHRIGG